MVERLRLRGERLWLDEIGEGREMAGVDDRVCGDEPESKLRGNACTWRDPVYMPPH